MLSLPYRLLLDDTVPPTFQLMPMLFDRGGAVTAFPASMFAPLKRVGWTVAARSFMVWSKMYSVASSQLKDSFSCLSSGSDRALTQQISDIALFLYLPCCCLQVATQSPSSLAITSAALTVGQTELLLSNSSDIALSSVQALPVCGNGVCEVGERPNVASVGLTAKGAGPPSCCRHCGRGCCQGLLVHLHKVFALHIFAWHDHRTCS